MVQHAEKSNAGTTQSLDLHSTDLRQHPVWQHGAAIHSGKPGKSNIDLAKVNYTVSSACRYTVPATHSKYSIDTIFMLHLLCTHNIIISILLAKSAF